MVPKGGGHEPRRGPALGDGQRLHLPQQETFEPAPSAVARDLWLGASSRHLRPDPVLVADDPALNLRPHGRANPCGVFRILSRPASISPMRTKLLLSTFVVGSILGSTMVDSASEPRRPTSAPAKALAVEECCKQQGGAYDPAKKGCTVYTFSEMAVSATHDAIRQCLSSKTGIPRDQIPLNTRYIR